MKIILNKAESEQYFYNALVNGLTYFCNSYGFVITWNEMSYMFAAAELQQQSKEKDGTLILPCFEDILMQMLRTGETITFHDIEGEEEYTKDVTLDLIHKRVCKAAVQHLIDMNNVEDDACTADAIIQAVLFDGEMIFG